MKTLVAVVCALVIALHSEECLSLEYTLENSGNVIEKLQNEDLSSFGTEKTGPIRPIFNKLSDKNEENHETFENDGYTKSRIVRQAYQGQTSLYPSLPSGPPNGQQSYSNYNNQNPPYNPQSQNPYNNQPQSGYPPPSNGYQSNYNNPYGSNQLSQYNNTLPTYSISNGYTPVNYTHNNSSGPYGHNSNPNSWQSQYPSSNGQGSYNSFNGSYPPNNAFSPYPGYKPANPSSRPPYNQPGQFQNNSYSGYQPQFPGNRPTTPYPYNQNQRPQYYPGQGQVNNTRYPQVVPGNQHPVNYDYSTKRPGQSPYGSFNASNWSGNPLSNTQSRPPYSNPNGQYPQYSNSYPGSPGYGTQNSTYPYNTPNQGLPGNPLNNTQSRPPYSNPNGQYPQYSNSYPGSSGYGTQNSTYPYNTTPNQGPVYQNPSNNYPGHSPDSPTFNLAHGYNTPRIPDRPPYGNGAQYFGNGPGGINTAPNQFLYPNGTLHDPSKVSPNVYNSH